MPEPDNSAPEPVHPGDIVQITDQAHKWFPTLLVVDEVRAWGVQAFCFMPSNDGAAPGHAYMRLKSDQFSIAGAALLLTPDLAKARAASLETTALVERERAPKAE